MAITGLHYNLLRQLKASGILPQGGRVLEIGEANWYGDTCPEVLIDDILNLPPDEKRQAKALFQKAMGEVVDSRDSQEELLQWRLFNLAKVVYQIVLAPQSITSIDLHGTPAALKLDLNQPIILLTDDTGQISHNQLVEYPLSRREPVKFDCVFNHGTLEHLFNAAEGYRTMHNHCKVGGLLIHEAPLTGWVDHGLLHPQPGLFFDLALANKYQILLYAIECLKEQMIFQVRIREELHKLARERKLPDDAMSFVVFKKTADNQFQIPIQGLYAGTISEEAQQSWHELR